MSVNLAFTLHEAREKLGKDLNLLIQEIIILSRGFQSAKLDSEKYQLKYLCLRRLCGGCEDGCRYNRSIEEVETGPVRPHGL